MNSTEQELRAALVKSRQYIKQLCSTVNHFAPGKVREEDFTEPVDMALANHTQTDPKSEKVLEAVYESGLHQSAPGVLTTKWKDGIDIDEPSAYLMNFARKITRG